MHFHIARQLDSVDCGPACLKMITKYYGKNYSISELRGRSHINRMGVSLHGICEAAENIGFRTNPVKINYLGLKTKLLGPCIIHWNNNHFVVVYSMGKKIHIADPSFGRIRYSLEEFKRGFISNDNLGFALLIFPTSKFYEMEDKTPKKRSNFYFLLSYLKYYSKYLIMLFIGLITSSFILLLTPFLTQALVDYGINKQNITFVYIVLLAQLMLFIGTSVIEIIRSWILLHLGTRINISIVSDFLKKLLSLPVKYFRSKMIGDILERIEDHKRIEALLTTQTLATLFSFINIFVFGVVLLIYNFLIFSTFFIGSVISTAWVFAFLKKRRTLDYKRFRELSLNKGKLIELIEGIEEIKGSNSEGFKRWEWESVQAHLFDIKLKSLSLAQIQQNGSTTFTQFKNISITFFAAKEVIEGRITIGAMMAIMYIIGQLNTPIAQILNFAITLFDAKIGLERIKEIHNENDEQSTGIEVLDKIPLGQDIVFENVSFSYSGSESNWVIERLNLLIPSGCKTAILGLSGSGKTTLLRLLLKHCEPQRGKIYLGTVNFSCLPNFIWREHCGVVFQDGYIFSDSIAGNVALGKVEIDYNRLKKSLRIANIEDFVNKALPLKMKTKIGNDGLQLSKGQIQRLLLARAVYKQPQYLFLDEATSSLDATNEKKIIDNLNEFFKRKTVVVIAHRLSTVKDADKIVVIDKGKVVEEGKHEELIKKRGNYYNLIKNQLELGQD